METLTADFERSVRAPIETTRRTVLAALEQAGFTVQRAQGGQIEAHRGSDMRGFGRGTRPLRVTVAIVAQPPLSTLRVHLVEGTRMPVAAQSLVRAYWPLFVQVQQQVDAWLQQLDAGVQTEPLAAPQVRVGGGGEPWMWVMASDAAAVLTPNEVQMFLAVGEMVMAQPDALPAAPARQLAEFLLQFRRAVDAASPPSGRLELAEAHRRVVEFLHQQVRIRESLPVREVHVCRECRFEKIFNPDYDHVVKRNKRLRDMLGLVGVSIGTSGASPNLFVVAGRLLNMKQLDPSFVCPRCQGMRADVMLATICPQCGTIRKEPVLRVCDTAGCGYDFRRRAAGDPVWGPPPATPGRTVYGAPAGLAPTPAMPQVATAASTSAPAPAPAVVASLAPAPSPAGAAVAGGGLSPALLGQAAGTAAAAPVMSAPAGAAPLVETWPAAAAAAPAAVEPKATAPAAEAAPAPTPAPAVEPPGVEAWPAPETGWYADPSGRHALRWFEVDWTQWTADGDRVAADPL